MPRRNRRDWHHHHRMIAERKKADRRRRRLERKLETSAFDQVARLVRAAPAALVDHLEAQSEGWLRTVAVSGRPLRRSRALFAALRRVAPSLASLAYVPSGVLLAGAVWASEPDTLPARGPWTWERVVQHLLGPYPVPGFLLRACHAPPEVVMRVPEERSWIVQVASNVARGVPLTVIAGTPAFPAVLTRRMAHLFLTAEGVDPYRAVRAAQVRGRGGARFLVDALMAGPLAQLQAHRGPVDEPWVAELIDWLCRTPGVTATGLAVMIERLVAMRAAGDLPELSGRSFVALRARAASWAALRDAASRASLPASGLSGWSWTCDEGTWSVHELTTPEALLREGAAMHHCVGLYEHTVRRGGVSLWSLRLDGERVLTAEVVARAGRVVQVRGFANRLPERFEIHALRVWMDRFGLAFGGLQAAA